MRKILVSLLLVVLFVMNASAQCFVIRRPIVSGGGGGGCDSCSSGLILTSHFENDDDITQGTPCGCNANADITWTRTGTTYSNTQQTDGSYSIYRNGSTQRAAIATNVDKTAGTLIFDIYVSSATTNVSHIMWYVDANNYIKIGVSPSSATAERITYSGSGTVTGADTPSGQLTTGTWHTVRAKWRTASSPYLSIQIDNNTPEATSNALGSFTGTPANMTLGTSGSETDVFYMDNLKLYNMWQ